jgi:hypothetical protein
MLFFGFVIANSVVLQGLRGQSLGKRIVGTKLGRPVQQGLGMVMVYPGIWACVKRLLVNVLVSVFIITALIPLLGPLHDWFRRTIGDRAAKTVVLAPSSEVVLERGSGGLPAI